MCLHMQYDAFTRKINPQTWGSTRRGPVETGQACLARLRCGPSTLEWKRITSYATGLWGNMSSCFAFPEQYNCAADSSPLHPTVWSLASTKCSSSMLEMALPTLPCLHLTVETEGLRRKASALLLETEGGIAVSIFLDPLEEMAASSLKHHPLETVSAGPLSPLPVLLCSAFLPQPPNYSHTDTSSQGLLGWLLRNLSRFSLTMKLLLLVCILLAHFQTSPKRSSEGIRLVRVPVLLFLRAPLSSPGERKTPLLRKTSEFIC